jgi:hypothetical protein
MKKNGVHCLLMGGQACVFYGAAEFSRDIDLATMRGVDGFPELWDRRTTIQIDDLEVDLLSLPDLVRAKRTQRDKDWPMTARLLEAHYYQNKNRATSQMVCFWLAEIHDRELLQEIAGAFPQEAQEASKRRIALHHLLAGNQQQADELLREEIEQEKRADREYWGPLRQELNQLRGRRQSDKPHP